MANKKWRDMGYTNISKKERKKRAKYNRQRDKKVEDWED